MAESSLCHHMERYQGRVMTQIQGLEFGRGVPETYAVSLPRLLISLAFLVEGCLSREHTLGRLR